MMKRRHWFEIEDQSWFPAFIRNYMTDYLGWVANAFDFYRPVVPKLLEGLRHSGGTTIIDLASGGGGGLPKLADALRDHHHDLKIVLTDLYPNQRAFETLCTRFPDVFTAEPQSVNAQAVPKRLAGLRTMFLSFHHFRPPQALSILQNAVDDRAPIAIFEAQKRDFIHLFKFAFSPLMVCLLTPLIRPFRWGRLLFTYLVPVVPACVFWDGLVSVLRTYSLDELRGLVSQVSGSEHYEWDIAEVDTGKIVIPYLLGYPCSDSDPPTE